MSAVSSFECPPSLLERARRSAPLPVAVVNANSPLTLESARLAADAKIMLPELVGNPDMIRSSSDDIGWDIAGLPIHVAATEEEAAAVAVALAREERVAALMKGDVHTDTLMRAVVNPENGLNMGRHMSHVFRMTQPGSDKALCITDAVINVLPTVEQKVSIALNAVALLQSLGHEQVNVAVLSATEVEVRSIPSSIEAGEVCRILADRLPAGVNVDGPMALDIALSHEAAKIKGVSGAVAGQADVLLVPNIETGNALFKMMVHLMGATAAGVVLGARVPIMLTSRADPAQARLASAALAMIYSQGAA